MFRYKTVSGRRLHARILPQLLAAVGAGGAVDVLAIGATWLRIFLAKYNSSNID
jgi:hypothetical protein